MKDVNTKIHCLPLSDEGVFGKGLEEKLKTTKRIRKSSYQTCFLNIMLISSRNVNFREIRHLTMMGRLREAKPTTMVTEDVVVRPCMIGLVTVRNGIKGNPVIPKGEEGSRIWIPFAFQR